MKYRKEKDSLGRVLVPSDKYYGAQTTRSLSNFRIGSEKMPKELIYALAILKHAAALTNYQLGDLTKEKKDLIIKACKEIYHGEIDQEFPLSVWQTGSGTQTNMNVNEVIANRISKIQKRPLGSYKPVHPNDDVNMSQSSNDIFPSAIHLTAYLLIEKKLLPSLEKFHKTLRKKEKEFKKIIMVGRTHLMDAVPIELRQEFSGYRSQLEYAMEKLEKKLPDLSFLPIGGTAVGTGLNSRKKYASLVCKNLSDICKSSFKPAHNRFSEISAKDRIVMVSSTLRLLAVIFYKIANDIRLAGSGPRAGINELQLPANEPGSSIMPGKVNPTQCEALSMVAIQVMGNDSTIGIAGSQGHFQLNANMPLIAYNLFQSIHLLADGANNFTKNCLTGLKPNRKIIKEHLQRSLMSATALNRQIGYDATSKIVKKAYEEDISLKEAATRLKLLTSKEFDTIVNPARMIYPNIT